MRRSALRVLAAVGIFAVQWLILGRLRIFGTYPDGVLLFLGWYALRRGRRSGALAGFGLGLAMDVVYGTWGTHAFVKTLIGFLVGSFAVEDRASLIIRPRQALLGGLVLALLHNGLLVALLALQTQTTTGFLLYGLWLGSALYTACVAAIVSLFRS